MDFFFDNMVALIKCFLAFAKFVHFWKGLLWDSNHVEIFEEKIDIPFDNYENKKKTNQKSCAEEKTTHRLTKYL